MFYLLAIIVVIIALGYLLKTTLELVDDGGETESTQKTESSRNGLDISTNVISICFGSQTGTAENYAHEIANFLRKRGFLVDVVDLEFFSKASFAEGTSASPQIALFLLATYGEGEPTDNAKTFYEWVKSEEARFPGVRYSVLGLGNSQYEHYNTVAKDVDRLMEARGAERLSQLLLCDAAGGGGDEDFAKWAKEVSRALDTLFHVKDRKGYDDQPMATRKNFYIQMFESEEAATRSNKKLPASSAKLDHVTKKLMKVREKRELQKSGDRRFLHVELDLEDKEDAYETGDHLAIYPENKSSLVERFAVRTSIDLDKWVIVRDDVAASPFPVPCTLRKIFTSYLDLNCCVKQDWLAFLAELALSDDDRRNLNWLSEDSFSYQKHIVKGYKNIVDVLADHKSVHLTLENILQILPRVQPRYYSISSSSSSSPKQVHLTLKVLEEEIDRPGQSMESRAERRFEGTCSSFLSCVHVGCSVQAQLRRSPFKLPKDLSTPIILVGAGTGIAPLRAMYLEAHHAMKISGVNVDIAFFYGCRKEDEDCLYREEMESMMDAGVINSLHFAFSRETSKKIYVQDRIRQQRTEVAQIMQKQGCIYVCGSISMASEVRRAFVDVLISMEGSEEAARERLRNLQATGRYQQDIWS
mmetsp:Transcript_12947/g.45516  ORF Transcript_12947/g.45516 Transcript_12947/m.45516 type:complete len:642 (-) Transcript_12947:599-2524(-)